MPAFTRAILCSGLTDASSTRKNLNRVFDQIRTSDTSWLDGGWWIVDGRGMGYPMKLVKAACVVIVLSIAASAHAQIQDAAVTGGRVAGVVANGVASFKGVPFAASPVGTLRWKAPQAVTPWSGVKQATAFGPSCIQDPNFATLFGAPAAFSEMGDSGSTMVLLVSSRSNTRRLCAWAVNS